MSILKKLVKNKLFLIGLLVPLVFQIIYLSLALPAVKDGNTRMTDLRIAIVNEDTLLGQEVSAKLVQVLPFQVQATDGLTASLEAMNQGDYNMVVYIAQDFTDKSREGAAQVSYYINQSAPAMTKQAMERTALNINQVLNENAFAGITEALKQNLPQTLSSSGLPAAALSKISSGLDQAFASLQYNSIGSDIQKVNNSDGFAQTVFPFFIFLIYFVGALILTALHSQAYKSLNKEFSCAKILLTQLSVNVAVSLVIPCIVIGLAAAFAVPFTLDLGLVWLLLTVGFFTFICLVQMFANWFGIPGMGVAAVLLFPLQLVSSGLIYSKEILPAFYSGISNYLPASYFGDGILKLFYGGASISWDVGILLAMSAIFLIVSSLRPPLRGVASEASP